MTSLNEKLSAMGSMLGQPGTRKAAAWPKGAAILELRLPHGWPENAAAVPWCLRKDAEVLEQGVSAELAELAAKAAGARLLVWSPAGDTLLTETTIPSRNRAKIMQALPYALEEQLLGDPDSQHYVYEPLGGGRLAVAVTLGARIEAWLNALQTAGLRPVTLCPATLALPHAQDAWAFAFAGAEAWLRSGRFGGAACAWETGLVPAVLKTALREARAGGQVPTTLLVFNPPADFDRESWATELDMNVIVEPQGLWESQRTAPPELNLLQGEFAQQTQTDSRFAQLRPAALLLALWALSSIGTGLWEWRQLKGMHLDNTREMTRLFRSSFPEAKAVVDPALQMQRKLDELQTQSGGFSDGDFLPLLAQSTPAIKSQAQASVENLKYNDTGLTLGLRLPDFQSLEALKNRLASGGLTVEVINANSTAEGVVGRLRISAAGGAGG